MLFLNSTTLAVSQMRLVRVDTHLWPRGNPRQWHRGFFAQPFGYRHFPGIPFAFHR
jgi:hypothetical protein